MGYLPNVIVSTERIEIEKNDRQVTNTTREHHAEAIAPVHVLVHYALEEYSARPCTGKR